MYNRNGYDMRPLDKHYPHQTKFADDPQHMGTEEVLPINLSGEVELIARASYKLGIAEAHVGNLFNELRETRERAEKAEEALATATEKRNTYEGWYRTTRAENDTLKAEVEKLKKRLAPPKKKVAKKKGAK
jgi:hypothetical protein